MLRPALHSQPTAPIPTSPIRMLVGFAPGGGTDTTARALTPKLAERLGQQVIVDNRPGAAGNIATEIVTKAPADGYTILHGHDRRARDQPDALRQSAVRSAEGSRAGHACRRFDQHPRRASDGAGEDGERADRARARPKSLNGGSSGVGGAGHLALELFNVMAGTKITHVPYKGGGPAMTDLLGGQINLIFATAASAVPHVQSGKIRALAVTTAKRSQLVPDLPTVAEAGLPGFEANNWYGVVVPAKTPQPDHRPAEQGIHRRAQHARRQARSSSSRASTRRRARPKRSAPTSSRRRRSGRR